MTNHPTILFGVTSSQSLKLLGSLPQTLVELDWDVHVVSNNDTHENPKNLRGVTVHHLPMSRKPAPISDLFSFIRWIILVKEIKPSIVSIGTPKAALLGLIASKLCRVPVRIYHLRGLRLETVRGIWGRVLHLLEFFAAKSSTAILAVSESLKEEYCRLLPSQRDKVTVLGLGSSHGVDLDLFNPERWAKWTPPQSSLRRALRAKVPILGFVGRFSEDKGAKEILSIGKALSDRGAEHTLVIVGPLEGGGEVLSRLLNLGSHVVVTGPVREVAPYYSIMDVLLLPTRREGFPNVVLEAAALGVPAVTTTATGAIDSVVDGETGLIVRVRDDGAINQAIQNLLADFELRITLGRNARARVIRDFSEQYVANLHLSFLLGQLDRHGKDGSPSLITGVEKRRLVGRDVSCT